MVLLQHVPFALLLQLQQLVFFCKLVQFVVLRFGLFFEMQLLHVIFLLYTLQLITHIFYFHLQLQVLLRQLLGEMFELRLFGVHLLQQVQIILSQSGLLASQRVDQLFQLLHVLTSMVGHESFLLRLQLQVNMFLRHHISILCLRLHHGSYAVRHSHRI